MTPKSYNDREGILGRCLCVREVPALLVRLEDGDFHGSLGTKISHDQEGNKSPTDSVDPFASRI